MWLDVNQYKWRYILRHDVHHYAFARTGDILWNPLRVGDILDVYRLSYSKTITRYNLEPNREIVDEILIVYKLVLEYGYFGSVVWLQHVEVKNIGDEALFLGDNHSVSVLASNFPQGCLQPNSIYYNDIIGMMTRLSIFGPLPNNEKEIGEGLRACIFD